MVGVYLNKGQMFFGEKSQKIFWIFVKKVLTIGFGCDIIFKRSGERSKRVDDGPPKKRMAKRFLRADTKNFKKSFEKSVDKKETMC